MKGETTLQTVHTMPLDELRPRAREARRLIAQAREIARLAFENHEGRAPDSGDASHRVGFLFDAVHRLLPGMTLLEDRSGPISRTKRKDDQWRRVTLRAGAGHALEELERGQILEELADDAVGLIAEIGRRTSAVIRVGDAAPASDRGGTAGR